jgi:hypothetical protein
MISMLLAKAVKAEFAALPGNAISRSHRVERVLVDMNATRGDLPACSRLAAEIALADKSASAATRSARPSRGCGRMACCPPSRGAACAGFPRRSAPLPAAPA